MDQVRRTSTLNYQIIPYAFSIFFKYEEFSLTRELSIVRHNFRVSENSSNLKKKKDNQNVF